MNWNIIFSDDVDKAFAKLETSIQKRIVRFLDERLAVLPNPRVLGEPMKGNKFAGLWRYRVGDYRVLCQIEDEKIVILVVEVGHRKKVYGGH